MKYVIISILSMLFLYFNYKIIEKDIKEKIIPNKYLLYLIYLLPIILIYIFFSYKVQINYILLLFQIFLGIFVCFLLYYFWIWWAWDAKYLLVLSLFVSYIWIIPFIWNISLLMLTYLISYFIYFYFWKCIINYKYAKSLYKNIYTDLKDKFIIFIKHTDWKIYKKTTFKIIFNTVLLFLFIFVWFRLVRLYLITDLLSNKNDINGLGVLIKTYHIYFIAMTFWVFWISRKILIRIFIKIKSIIESKLWIKIDKTKSVFPVFLFFILFWFIVYEYIINPYEILTYLYRIFTLYITLFIIFRIIIYSYKLTFHISESYYIEISELKPWEIVDKEQLKKMFSEQECLGFKNTIWILSPDPKLYFSNIDNPLDQETSNKLKEIYTLTNEYHINNETKNFEKFDKIKVLKTFAFAWYVFAWFLLTVVFQDKIFKIISNLFVDFVKNIYN